MNNQKGKNNPNYKDGRTLKKYYCIECGNKISYKTWKYGKKRCKSCSKKGQFAPLFKDGRTLKRYYCDCGEEINFSTALYSKGKCSKCADKLHSLRMSGKGNSMYGKIGYWANKKKPAQSKRMKGKNNPNWQNGISKLPYAFDFTSELKNSIRTRDNFECQLCNKKQKELNGYHKKLTIHHIDYNKQNCKEDNLITLCKECNSTANFNRDYWYAYFKYILEDISK